MNVSWLRKILLLLVLFTAFQSSAKEDTLIYFQKISNGKSLALKLPLKCRVYYTEDDKRFGQITDYNQEVIFFKYKDYDSSDVDAIMEIDSLSRREKYDLMDSLIQESVVIKEIPVDSIYKISVLSGSDNLTRELSMLGSSVLTLGSIVALLVDLSQNVGQGMKWWNWLEIGGAAAGIGGMAVLMKRNIYMSKWKVIPRPS